MLVLLLAVTSLGCLYLGIRYLRHALALTATATSYIRSAAQGYVVFVGEGTPQPGSNSIVAPFSGKPCVWWSTQVESLLGPVSGERMAPSSDAFDKHFSSEPFLLRDGTGECLVDPAEADVHAVTKDIWYGSSMSGTSLRDARRSRGVDDDIRFVEERIELHQRIVARGYFQTHDNGGAKTNTLSQAPDGRHFVLSTVREDVLAERLRFKAVLALGLFVLLASCAVFAGESGG